MTANQINRSAKLGNVLSYLKKYSGQISFASFVIVFLSFSVNEGQAYGYDNLSYDLSSEISQPQNDGFIGNPQLFVGQTVSTGEIQQAAAIIHEVEPKDTLISVANRYGISVASILDANNINAKDIEKIKPGTELLIPAQDTNTSLAWLDEINKVKAQEAERARKEQEKRLAANRQQSQRNSRANQVGSVPSIGGVEFIGTYRLGYNGGYPGQCTSWANEKRKDLPNGMGNAGQYLASARKFGFAVSSIPSPGYLMVSAESSWGHVAYVESVSGSSFTVTEMNYLRPYAVSRRTIAIGSPFVRGFVGFKL